MSLPHWIPSPGKLSFWTAFFAAAILIAHILTLAPDHFNSLSVTARDLTSRLIWETRAESAALFRRDDYSCSASRPCKNGACCGGSGFCGYGWSLLISPWAHELPIHQLLTHSTVWVRTFTYRALTGPTYCGAGCLSNCNATAECGQYAKEVNATCALNVWWVLE